MVPLTASVLSLMSFRGRSESAFHLRSFRLEELLLLLLSEAADLAASSSIALPEEELGLQAVQVKNVVQQEEPPQRHC